MTANIITTPNVGTQIYLGSGASTAITMNWDNSEGSLIFDGSAGQLFSIVDSLTGSSLVNIYGDASIGGYLALKDDASLGSSLYVTGDPNQNILLGTDGSTHVGIGFNPRSTDGRYSSLEMFENGHYWNNVTNIGPTYSIASGAYNTNPITSWKYSSDDEALLFTMSGGGGDYIFYTAPLGTEDVAVTWVPAMTINATQISTGTDILVVIDGSLSIGSGSIAAGYKLELFGTGNKGRAADWTATSDERLKNEFTTYKSVLEGITQLKDKFGTFKWKDSNDYDIGYKAQDILPIFPEFVGGSDREMYDLSYMKMAGLGIQGVAELREEKDQEISELRKEIQELKYIVNKLIDK